MRIILLGAPGAGKGTVAEMLIERFNITAISTGDILRSAVKEGNELGAAAEDYMKRGELVPDSLIMDIMEKRLRQDDCSTGFILDGFPRTIPQAQSLSTMLERLNLELDAVVNLDVSEEIILRRLTSRRTCSNPECQAIYNIYTKPSKMENICDKCGSPTVQRDDETEDAIRNRLQTYKEKTAPLVSFYSDNPKYISVPAEDAGFVIDEIMKFVRA